MSSEISISNKMIRLKETAGKAAAIWAEITELAKGPNIKADLGQGFPDFDGDSVALSAARCRFQPSGGDAALARQHQYSPVLGPLGLRQALSQWYAARYPCGLAVDPQHEMLVCTSGTEALYVAMLSLLNPGDRVLVFEPAFPWYRPHIELADAVMVALPLRSFPDFSLPSEDALREAFSAHRPRMVIFNNPHNPSGHVAAAEELQLLARLCTEYDAICLSDEVYEVFTFGDPPPSDQAPADPSRAMGPDALPAGKQPSNPHLRMCDQPGMAARTLTVGSASKMFSLTGWRVGWLYSHHRELLAACTSLHGYLTYCAPTPLQEAVKDALLDALRFPSALPQEIAELQRAFHQNARELARCLQQHLNVAVAPPQGGYFLVVDVSACGQSDIEFCSNLAREKGVVAIPMRVFYSDSPPTNLVRFAICKSRPLISKAIRALEQ